MFAFRGKRKIIAWQAWNVFPEDTSTFEKLRKNPTAVEDNDLHVLVRFVAIMYGRSSTADNVNETKMDLLVRKKEVI